MLPANWIWWRCALPGTPLAPEAASPGLQSLTGSPEHCVRVSEHCMTLSCEAGQRDRRINANTSNAYDRVQGHTSTRALNLATWDSS